MNTFLLTDRIRSAAVKFGGGGVLAGAATTVWPPWGEGSCDVLATSPTATQVEQDLEAWSNRWVGSIRNPQRCREFKASSDTALRNPLVKTFIFSHSKFKYI